MLLHCPSKKCNTTRDHKLEVEGNLAICMECGDANKMASDFIKKAMKNAGEIYKTIQKKQAFMYKCVKCNVNRGIKVIDERVVCDTCQHPMNLNAPTLQAIKAMGIGALPKNATEADTTEEHADENSKNIGKRKKVATE